MTNMSQEKEEGKPQVCETFEPQTWRKSVCKNCFQAPEKHGAMTGFCDSPNTSHNTARKDSVSPEKKVVTGTDASSLKNRYEQLEKDKYKPKDPPKVAPKAKSPGRLCSVTEKLGIKKDDVKVNIPPKVLPKQSDKDTVNKSECDTKPKFGINNKQGATVEQSSLVKKKFGSVENISDTENKETMNVKLKYKFGSMDNIAGQTKKKDPVPIPIQKSKFGGSLENMTNVEKGFPQDNKKALNSKQNQLLSKFDDFTNEFKQATSKMGSMGSPLIHSRADGNMEIQNTDSGAKNSLSSPVTDVKPTWKQGLKSPVSDKKPELRLVTQDKKDVSERIIKVELRSPSLEKDKKPDLKSPSTETKQRFMKPELHTTAVEIDNKSSSSLSDTRSNMKGTVDIPIPKSPLKDNKREEESELKQKFNKAIVDTKDPGLSNKTPLVDKKLTEKDKNKVIMKNEVKSPVKDNEVSNRFKKSLPDKDQTSVAKDELNDNKSDSVGKFKKPELKSKEAAENDVKPSTDLRSNLKHKQLEGKDTHKDNELLSKFKKPELKSKESNDDNQTTDLRSNLKQQKPEKKEAPHENELSNRFKKPDLKSKDESVKDLKSSTDLRSNLKQQKSEPKDTNKDNELLNKFKKPELKSKDEKLNEVKQNTDLRSNLKQQKIENKDTSKENELLNKFKKPELKSKDQPKPSLTKALSDTNMKSTDLKPKDDSKRENLKTTASSNTELKSTLQSKKDEDRRPSIGDLKPTKTDKNKSNDFKSQDIKPENELQRRFSKPELKPLSLDKDKKGDPTTTSQKEDTNKGIDLKGGLKKTGDTKAKDPGTPEPKPNKFELPSLKSSKVEKPKSELAEKKVKEAESKPAPFTFKTFTVPKKPPPVTENLDSKPESSSNEKKKAEEPKFSLGKTAAKSEEKDKLNKLGSSVPTSKDNASSTHDQTKSKPGSLDLKPNHKDADTDKNKLQLKSVKDTVLDKKTDNKLLNKSNKKDDTDINTPKNKFEKPELKAAKDKDSPKHLDSKFKTMQNDIQDDSLKPGSKNKFELPKLKPSKVGEKEKENDLSKNDKKDSVLMKEQTSGLRKNEDTTLNNKNAKKEEVINKTQEQIKNKEQADNNKNEEKLANKSLSDNISFNKNLDKESKKASEISDNGSSKSQNLPSKKDIVETEPINSTQDPGSVVHSQAIRENEDHITGSVSNVNNDSGKGKPTPSASDIREGPFEKFSSGNEATVGGFNGACADGSTRDSAPIHVDTQVFTSSRNKTAGVIGDTDLGQPGSPLADLSGITFSSGKGKSPVRGIVKNGDICEEFNVDSFKTDDVDSDFKLATNIELEKLRNELDLMRERCQNLEKENENLSKSLSQKEIEETELKKQKHDFETSILGLKSQMKKMEERCSNLESDNSNLAGDLKAQRETNQSGEIDDKMTARDKMMEDLLDENETLKQEINDLKAEMEEMYDSFRDQEAEEFRELQKELEITAKNCRILQFKLRKMERRNEQIEHDRDLYEDKLRTLQNQFQDRDAVSHIRSLEDELRMAKEVSVRLHDELDLMEDKRGKLSEENRHLTELLEQSDRKQFRLEMEIDKLRDKVIQLKQEARSANGDGSKKLNCAEFLALHREVI